ncbi:ArsR/SmtB family transcription factor [Aeromicrobium wangtongii]|uniref:Metalloregulator ArsR/SmtB family transcription factor n=1 Tax=Aeromicrobium wangtongii TaxID=2969247 RepID=A0ABY5M386_9ACTN|nr:metalloregulator ArsR/SmtB family transcription factor [Aeromicrobium wangtongii]MCD9198644.1 metalloregulator ArsR/SmtB family transcription factor [Aeromicrobium wangtongii]UUP12668.1 metalloregulator ArsR/SmtB family transcription factor [Aeromicrobium wangtongii]
MSNADQQDPPSPPVTPAPGEPLDWVGTFGLLSDPTRMKILLAIHDRPDSAVFELAEATALPTNTVTQALRTLHHAGVVSVRREGRYRRWTLVQEAAHQLLHHISDPPAAAHGQ